MEDTPNKPLDNPFRDKDTNEDRDDLPMIPEENTNPWPSGDRTLLTPLAHAPKPRGDNPLFKAKAYLPEYLIMLFMLASLVGAANSLIGIGIDALIKAESTDASSTYSYLSSYTSSFDTFELIWSLAILVIALPVFILLFVRTKKAESYAPEIVEHRWRKVFLGTFITVEALALICIVTALAFDMLSRLIDADGILGVFGAREAADPWWQILLVCVLNAALLGYVVMAMAANYREVLPAMKAKVFGFVIVVVSLVAVGLQLPAIIEQRGKAEDQQKSQDISALESKINSYVSKSSSKKLPASLADLSLDDSGLKSRLKNYEYTPASNEETYKICASFNTKSSGSSYETYPAVDSGASSTDSMYYSSGKNSDPYKHGMGRDCFEFTNYYSAYRYDYNSLFGDSEDSPSALKGTSSNSL